MAAPSQQMHSDITGMEKKWKNTFPMQCFIVIYSQICESKRQPTEYNEELVATKDELSK